MDSILNLIMSNGVTGAVLAYFIWKDSSFNKELIDVISKFNVNTELLISMFKGGFKSA